MEKVKRKTTKRSKRRTKASTDDVLGDANLPTKVNKKWQKHYRMLTDLRTKLRNEKGQLLKDALAEDAGIRGEMADVGTNSYDRDWALSMISAEQNALYEIEQALHRIRTDSYGVCEVTGKPISLKRLNAIPWTRFSAETERDLEKRGELPRAKLGDTRFIPRVASNES